MKAEPTEEAQEGARPEVPGTASGGGTASPVSPVSDRAADVGAAHDTSGGLPLGGVAEEDDGLPSFSAEEEALDPPETAGGSSGAAPAHEPGREEAPTQRLGDEGADGARAREAAASGSPPSPRGRLPSCGHRGPGTGASPLGATSPPAATVFGGGILDPTPGGGVLPVIAHAVPLDSDSDSGLEVDELTAAGTNGAAGRRSGPQSH